MPLSRYSRVLCLVLASFLTVAVWAGKKTLITPQSLIASSDALYYYPTSHGVTDLSVDIVIAQQADDPATKDAHIIYLYAGVDHQSIFVSGTDNTKVQEQLTKAATPLTQYVLPRTLADTFAGAAQKLETVNTEITGVADDMFYQLITTPKNDPEGVTEYRTMLDKHGLIHQIENKTSDGNQIVASVDNVQSAAGWQISGITTRLNMNGHAVWKIEKIAYTTVDGFAMPTSYTVQYRDIQNKPASGLEGLTVTFTNYRINHGAAAAAFAAAQKSATDTTTPAAPTPTPTPAPATPNTTQ